MTKDKKNKLLHITTFGCQMNQYDSGRLAGLMAQEGYDLTDDPREADLILLNTCSVRERPEHKVYSFLGALKDIKQKRPEVVIGVAGCVAQQEGTKLLDRIPHLDMVLGPGAVERFPELVQSALQGNRPCATSLGAEGRQIKPETPPRTDLKALVTIMQGCDNFCTYCVVPYVRGREFSRPAETILREVAGLVEGGAREVTLLGQNVNSYHDERSGLDFPGLLEKVADIAGLWRVRFTTSHPKDLSPSLIEAMGAVPEVMESLHLPAQCGSDRILKAMNRRYTKGHYLSLVEQLTKKVPSVALGSDIIVGFPGESDRDFRDTMDLLRSVCYDYVYSFKYSDRPFAKASGLPDKIDEETKSARLAELQDLQQEISLKVHRGLEGQVVEVLVEGQAKKGENLLTGRSRAGQAVNFPGGEELTGTLVKVKITEGRVNSLMGRLAEAAQGV